MRHSFAPPFASKDEEVKSILAGGTKLRFDPPIYDRDKPVKIIDITDDSASIRFEVHDQFLLAMIYLHDLTQIQFLAIE